MSKGRENNNFHLFGGILCVVLAFTEKQKIRHMTYKMKMSLPLSYMWDSQVELLGRTLEISMTFRKKGLKREISKLSAYIYI